MLGGHFYIVSVRFRESKYARQRQIIFINRTRQDDFAGPIRDPSSGR
jgi:hypothetical protein